MLSLFTFINYSCKKCEGCTNPKAENYNKDADIDDGSCIVKGCKNPKAQNYDPTATEDDGNCLIKGCTNPSSTNYDPEANVDDGSCIIKGCTDPQALNFNALANTNDGSCKYPKDLFIGKYTLVFECDSSLISGLFEGQTVSARIEEIPNEKNKVTIILELGDIIGDQSQEGVINGTRCVFDSPERVFSIFNQEAKIKSNGDINTTSNPNVLTGTLQSTITTSQIPFPFVVNCTFTATRK
jgi:hypothetical protein